MKALVRFSIGLFAVAAATSPPYAGAWCDVLFKDAALEADIVVLARVERPKQEPLGLSLVDVLKGECDRDGLKWLAPTLEDYDVKHDDHVLLALDGDRRLLRQSRGLGLCRVISVLPIRKGRLRTRDRVDYDSLNGTLTLEEIERELRHEFTVPSHQATLSGR